MKDIIRSIKLEVLDYINMNSLNEEEIREYVYDKVYNTIRKNGKSIDECVNISNRIYNGMFKLDVLQKYLDDIEISEIMINGLDNIIIEKNGKIITTDDSFESLEVFENMIQKIVSKMNRRVNASMPIVDVRLEDGSRVNIVVPPVSLCGPVMTIRKFDNLKYNLDYLVEINTLTSELAEFLKKMIRGKYNIFISGGTSSGKTTFLNALSEHIPSKERVITIEDSAELDLKGISNLISLETKPPNIEGEGEITMEMLIKSSLRMRPDRIVIGEIRGREALEMLDAMNTGHDGSLSTGHGNSCLDMLKRIELMILRTIEIPLKAIKQLNASSIDILIHLERSASGKRCVKEVIEILDYKDDYISNTLYIRKSGDLVKENDLINTMKMKVNGVINE